MSAPDEENSDAGAKQPVVFDSIEGVGWSTTKNDDLASANGELTKSGQQDDVIDSRILLSEVVEGANTNSNQAPEQLEQIGDEESVRFVSEIKSHYVPKRFEEKGLYLSSFSQFSRTVFMLATVVGPMIWVAVLVFLLSTSGLPNSQLSKIKIVAIASSLIPVICWSAFSCLRLLKLRQSTSCRLLVSRVGLNVGLINFLLFQLLLIGPPPGQVLSGICVLPLMIVAITLTLIMQWIGQRWTVMAALKIVTLISVLMGLFSYGPAVILFTQIGGLILFSIAGCFPLVTAVCQCLMTKYVRDEATARGLQFQFETRFTLFALLLSWLVTFGLYQAINWYDDSFHQSRNIWVSSIQSLAFSLGRF